MKNIVVFLAVVLLFSACQNSEKKTVASEVDSLSYHYDSVKTVSKFKPKQAKPFDSTKAVVTFPVFEDSLINTYIKRQVFNFFAEEEPATSYQDIVNSFVKGYDDFYSSDPTTFQAWYLDIRISVIRQTTTYLALKYSHADFAGGAHGNSSVSFLNYDLEKKAPVTLNSLIEEGKLPELTRIGESIFRKNEKISADAPLADRYFFDQGKFTLAQSFYVSAQGLVFLYVPYEIKPYVDGYTELIIPFSAIKTIAKPNTILSSTQ